MWELMTRISLRISSFLSMVEPEPDLCTKKYRLRLRNTVHDILYRTVSDRIFILVKSGTKPDTGYKRIG